MNIRKQNTFIEISEIGLKLEVKSDMLLNSLISETTKNVLEQMLKDKLSQLKTHFEEIDTKIESESKEHKSSYFNELKENPNQHILEYACLNRDLFGILGDVFEDFYNDNIDVMETISSIYRYSPVYGFESLETRFI